MVFSVLNFDSLLQYIYDLGEPYHKSEMGIDWYYDKETNQLMRGYGVEVLGNVRDL
ncbi:hypothetical protein P8610_12665 [Fictibacillus sp. UD]